MITIVKGNEKIVCTYGMFENQFKNLGYRLASENKKEAEVKPASSLKAEVVKDEEDAEKDKISTKYGLKTSKKSTTTKKEDK